MAVEDIGDIGVSLPGIVIIISAGSLVSLVIVVMVCACCHRPNVPQHRANVKRNVVEEEEMRTNTLGSKRPSDRRGKQRPPSMIFDGTPIGVGRWNDLTGIAEVNVPEKFRPEKPKPERPPNPPDVILHPSLIHALRSEKRPQSTIYLRTPVTPSPMRNVQPSTSLEELIAQNAEEKPETPLSRFPINRGEGVQEKSKDGSILYYRPKESAADIKRPNRLSQSRRVSRGRIRSSEEPRPVPEKQRRTRYETPSDPGRLEGLPRFDRTSGEWDNVPKPRKEDNSPPPLPSRKYLDDEIEVNAGVSLSDWSDDMPRPRNGDVTVDQALKVNGAQNAAKLRPNNHNDDPRSLGSSPQQNSRTPSPKRRLSGHRRVSNSSGSDSQHRPRPTHARREESAVPRNGSDNLAYSKDGSPMRRDYRNVPQHSDGSKYGQNLGDPHDRMVQGEVHVALDDRQRRNQRHRRVNDLIHENVPLSSYDPSRMHLLPGVYLRPKPYYPQAGMAEPAKRYSDASDYSDLLERSSYYADRVNRDYDPYFFRSRWSTTPDSAPEDMLRRRNSDFVLTEDYVPSRDQVSPRQPYRRSLIIEEHYDSDVIRDQAIQAGRISNLSSGYQSQSSRNDESPNDFNLRSSRRLLPTPPRTSNTPPGVVGKKYHPRLAQPPTHSNIQDIPLPDIPFRYHSPEQERRRLPTQPPPDVTPERYERTGRSDIQIDRGRAIASPQRHEVGGRRFKSPLSSVKERQSPSIPSQDVSPERSLSPITPQKRRKEQQPDLIESHSISTQAPEVVARGQQTDPIEEDYDEKSQSLDDAVDYNTPVGNQSDETRRPRDSATDEMESPLVSSTSDLSTSSKRPSTEFGSLIDIMYQYRQNVRDSRQKENPAESPESRLKYEREKLKSKLKKELEPRHRQTRNLELVIDTLLYLCERQNDNTVNKRSWHRDNSERLKSKSRPNSAILLTPTDDNPNGDRFSQVFSTRSDITKGSGDYASIQGDPTTPSHVTNEFIHQEKKKTHRLHDYHEINLPHVALHETQGKEFAFPSEQELNRILAQNNTPPPIPPRRNKGNKKESTDEEDTPLEISQRKTMDVKTPVPHQAPESKSEPTVEKISSRDSPPLKKVAAGMMSQPQKLIETQPASVGQKSKVEPPYAKVKKRSKPDRRRSLPSMHLSESEVKWFMESGGNVEEITKRRYKKFENGLRGEPRFQSTRVRGSNKEKRMWSPLTKYATKEVEEKVEEAFTFDDIPTGDTADAEDIITAIERQMSERQSPLKSPKGLHQSGPNSPFGSKPNIYSDSDMGTWSSAASVDVPVPSARRARFNRSDGHFPTSTENTPSGSPMSMNKQRFHTPPPLDGTTSENSSAPPVPLRKESLSPVKNYSVFHTPPISPHGPSPLLKGRRSSSVISIPRSASPKILPHSGGREFSPRKQHGLAKRPTRPMQQSKPSSAPVTPAIGPNSHLKGMPSKKTPKLPFGGKKFVEPSTPGSHIATLESARRRISRTGEIITIPADDDYAIPFDCLHNNGPFERSPNREIPRHQRSQGLSLLSPGLVAQPSSYDDRFTPIREDSSSGDGPDYDYAIPVNCPPNLLLRQRILSRSSENILRDFETAV